MASFRSEAEAFSGMSGMAEGHDRYARGLKPRALDRGVGSFQGLVIHWFDEMLKRVQHDILGFYATFSGTSKCFLDN